MRIPLQARFKNFGGAFVMKIASVIGKHVGEYVLGVLQSFGHLQIASVNCLTQVVRLAFPLLVDVRYHASFRAQDYLRVVLEIHLHYFVAEAEHHGMTGSYPLFDVDYVRYFSFRKSQVLIVLVFFGFD